MIYITYISAFIFYALSTLIHILVISKIIDFKLVNGGRSKTYEEQKKQSVASVFILVMFMLYVISTLLFPHFKTTVVFLIVTSLLILFWLFGTVIQILGTSFEKKVVIWINLLGVVSHILIMLSYFE